MGNVLDERDAALDRAERAERERDFEAARAERLADELKNLADRLPEGAI